jgi:prophage tail gpP-like protein
MVDDRLYVAHYGNSSKADPKEHIDDTLYVVHSGDTYECIAAHVYGDSSKANNIKEANGHLGEGQLQEGQKLIIPEIPERPRANVPASIPGKGKDDITILVNGKEVYPISARVRRAVDCAADGWTAIVEWQKGIKPFRYYKTLVYVGGELVINGILYGLSASSGKDKKTMTLEGFGITADIVDSAITGPKYQWYNQTLEQHAKEVLRPFGVLPVFEFDGGTAFGTIDAEPGTRVFDHLSELAFQRSLLISSSPSGNLLFTKAKTGKTVGTLDENGVRALGWSGTFDGRKRFHSYHAIAYSPLAGDKDIIAVDENIPRTRTMSFNVDDLYSWDVGYAAEWRRSKQVADSVSVVLPVEGWYAPDGSLWAANTLVTVVSETLFVPQGFTFLVKSVEFSYNVKTGRTTNVEIVPPGVYAERGTRTEDPWS